MSFFLIFRGVGMGAGGSGSPAAGISIILLQLENSRMQGRSVKSGATDESVEIMIFDADGTPDSSVTFATSGLSLWYWRKGGAVVPITPVTLASISASHTDGGFLLADDGLYRLDLPDAAVATGADRVYIGGSLSGKVIIGTSLDLDTYDPEEVAKEIFTG